MRPWSWSLAILLGLGGVVQDPLQDADLIEPADLVEPIQAIGRDAVGGDVAGLSIAVAIGPDVLVAQGWGYVSADEAADAESSYPVGSLMGAFLAVAALQLAEQEKLDLQSLVADHFEGQPYSMEKIRVRDLLAHTSGIPLVTGLEDAIPPLIAQLRELPLESTPGDCSSYNPVNELLLGHIVERIVGTTLAEILQARIFAPAEMENTGYEADPEPPARTYFWQEFGGSLLRIEGAPPFGGVGLRSMAPDLLRWIRAMVDRRLLNESSFQLWSSAPRLTGKVETSYPTWGHGVNLTELGDSPCFSVGGGFGGSRVHVAYYPARNLTIAVLAAGERADVAKLERKIARLFFGLPEPEAHDLPLPAEERQKFVGEYYVGGNSYEIAETEERLLMRSPFGREHLLAYEGGFVFVALDDPELRLTFELEDGVPIAFVLDEHGSTTRAKRLR